MLAVMEQSDPSSDAISDFLNTGRTGRRNALPDILGENANTGTGDLPAKLEQLSCQDLPAGEGSQPSTSKEGAAPTEKKPETASTSTTGS